MENLETILQQALQEFSGISHAAELEHAKARFLGKGGLITELLKSLGKLPPEQRPAAGNRINEVKQAVEDALIARRAALRAREMDDELQQEALDVTLPGRGMQQGGLHPVSLTLQRVENLFRTIGFTTATGPEIETEFFNFTALNIPENHPARAMHDTFYVDDTHILRTHTSPVQIHHMLKNAPPLRIIAPGRVYRCDFDVTHTPMFHQVEGLWVDRNVNFAALKDVLATFMQLFFRTRRFSISFSTIVLSFYRAVRRNGYRVFQLRRERLSRLWKQRLVRGVGLWHGASQRVDACSN